MTISATFKRGWPKHNIYFEMLACSFLGRVRTDSIIPELARFALGSKELLVFVMGEYEDMMLISLRSKNLVLKCQAFTEKTP